MQEIVQQTIEDLAALSKKVDTKTAQRIHEIMERLRASDQGDQYSTALYRELAR